MNELPRRRAAGLLALGLSACSQHPEPTASGPAPTAAATPSAATPGAATPGAAALPALDVQLLGERLGAPLLALPGGALVATLPRGGVSVNVEAIPIAGALNTELSFRPSAQGAALSGSVELLEDEVSPVIDTLLAHGIRVVGLYNRFLYDEPRVLVLRFEGQGMPALLASGAQSIGSVLRDARLRSSKPLRELPGDAPLRAGKLDAAALGGVLGVTASTKDGAVVLDVPRPSDPGAAPGTAAPLLTPEAPLLRASFSGSDLRAAVSGTFVLSASELVPVLRALRSSNVHLVGLVPRDMQGDAGWFSLHFRGKNTSLALVRGLQQALQARTAPP